MTSDVQLKRCTKYCEHGPDAVIAMLPLDPAAIAALRTPGTHLPPVSLPLLNGGRIDLQRTDGVPTVIVVFASWCDPCREEVRAVQRAAQGHPSVRVLGIDALESPDQARSFVRAAAIAFPTALVTDTVYSQTGVSDADRAKTGVDIPAVYLVDSKGRSTQAFLGTDAADEAKLSAAFGKLADQPQP